MFGRRLGFKEEGKIQGVFLKDGAYYDDYILTLKW
jgi:hypothetical protein